MFRDDDLSKSKVFEWLIVSQLKAEFFWRDTYKNEVDIILSNREIIPVEIKYGKLHFDGLLNFMRKFKINKGYIISFSMEGKHNFDGNNVDVIPAFKFLLRDNY